MLTGNANQVYDICYCHDDCESVTNYYKVGNLKMQEEIGLSSNTKEDSTDEGNLKMVQYMMKPGGMAFYGGITTL